MSHLRVLFLSLATSASHSAVLCPYSLLLHLHAGFHRGFFLVFIHPSSIGQIHWEQWSQREPPSQTLKPKHSANRRGPLQMSTSLHNSLEPLLKICSRPPSPCSSSTLSSLPPYDRGEVGAEQLLINLRPSLTFTIRFNVHN